MTAPSRTLRATRRRTALVVGVSLVALGTAACDVGGADAPPPSGSAAPARPLVISAPADCLTNAYCGRGLATVYGIDVQDRLIASPRVAQSVENLESGAADVAVVFSHSPAVTDPDLVVLDDDKGMLASERVTPVFRRSLAEVYGPGLRQDLSALSALLTQDALTALDAAVGSGAAPADAARSWLDRTGAAGGTDTDAEDPRPLVVGSADFLESRVLAEVISQFLAGRGYTTKVAELPGGRAELVDALANGDVDAAPEYSASLLEYLDGDAGEASTDAAATSARLAQYLDLIGVQAAAPAPATSTNVFVTTRALAQQRGLTTLSDLADAGVPAAAPTSPTMAPDTGGAPELGVMVRAVGHQLASGSSGPEVRDLQQRLARLGFDVEVTGTYDARTVGAVRRFQASQGLVSDGVTGPATAKALAAPAAAVKDPEPVEPGDRGVVAPPRTARSAGGGGGKVIYLTFDDGPAVTYTRQVLDLLDRYDAKATFFQLGQNATAHPALTQEVIRRGHAVGSHTWDHADMRRLSGSALDHEITSTSTALEKLIGRPVTCLRPPYGALDQEARAAIARHGLDLQLWDIDPQDWNRPGVPSIVSNIVGNARPGAVSLMHDGGGNRSQSVAALAQILPRLKAKGYHFEPLPGC